MEVDLMYISSLQDIDPLLTPYGFIKVHQSHLVNKEYISSFSKKEGFNLLFRKWRNYTCFKKQKRGSGEGVRVLNIF
jgi:DNA-binding LytR/AlgR family response regulator